MSEELSNRPNAPLDVLLADDDEMIAEFLKLQLTAMGCRVRVAPDGVAALEALEAERFHVLITDWMMPRLDGFDLTRVVRARPGPEANLHIIMMTARREPETAQRGLRAGVDDVLYKPIDAVELELCVASARRVVELHRRLERRNRHLAAAQQRARTAYDRLQQDLRAAGQMQRRLLPAERTQGPIRYAWAFSPSLHIGGDGLGVAPHAPERVFFFHFDVAGHGVPAALRSFAAHRRLMQLAPSAPQDLRSAAETLNSEVLADDDAGYLTLAAGLIEAGERRLHLLRAGHPPPLLIRRNGEAEYLEDGGLPIGLLPHADPQVQSLELEPGDKLLLYSDGIVEPDHGGFFTWTELLDLCRGSGGEPAQALARRLEGLVRERQASEGPADDVSILVIELAGEDGDADGEAPAVLADLEVEPTLDGVRAAAVQLAQAAKDHGLTEEIRMDLELAFAEAMNNVVLHGAWPDRPVSAQARLLRTAKGIELELSDTGRPAPEAALRRGPAEFDAEHGRGLDIIRACSDELDYVSSDGWNRWRIVKHLRPG